MVRGRITRDDRPDRDDRRPGGGRGRLSIRDRVRDPNRWYSDRARRMPVRRQTPRDIAEHGRKRVLSGDDDGVAAGVLGLRAIRRLSRSATGRR